jgi:hypothetical protein
MKSLKLLSSLLIVTCAACATTWSHLRTEMVGPVEVEIWRNNKTKECERRVYLDSYYFNGKIPCDYKVTDEHRKEIFNALNERVRVR